MTKYRFLTAAALGSLTSALLLAALPAAAQERGGWTRGARAEQRADNPGETRAAPQRAPRAERAERTEQRRGNRSTDGNPGWAQRRDASPGVQRDRGAEMAARAAARAQVQTDAGQAGRSSGYSAPRGGNYGANTRRDWVAQRQARDAAQQQQQQQQQQRSSGTWARAGDRADDARRAEWGNRSTDSRRADWQRNRSDDSRRADWQRNRTDDSRRADWQRERRDDARNYNNGYRDGRRDDNRWDNRYGQNHRRWDNRGWRNDNRYNWYRYRSANRSLFSLGRYYAPYRNYSYSRINIGFRLGSLFYSNRYWINDPWQYRLPAVYGPYRWVRYYDDALLVDIYSGEVVDVIHDFFW